MRQVVLFALAVAFATIGAGACKHGDDAAAVVVPGAAAGDVTEVAGEVSATRAGQRRALKVGDVVAGDDVVKTGIDGRVTIVLRHNHVAWSLGPDKEKQVSASAAWAAAAGATAEAIADDHSAAAGRHAERSATDTGESAAAPTGQPPPLQPPPPPVGSAAGSGSEDTIGLGNIGTIGHGAGAGSGEGFGNGHGQLGGGHVAHPPKLAQKVSVTGSLPAEIATRIVRQNLGRFRLCYENELRSDPTAAGQIVVKATVAATGEVTAAALASSTVAGDVGTCIARGVNGLSFPEADQAWQLTITLALAPGD